jgi:flavin reductase (DIM6/NTAB) family NADH-FMN oxidoreductase RutF
MEQYDLTSGSTRQRLTQQPRKLVNRGSTGRKTYLRPASLTSSTRGKDRSIVIEPPILYFGTPVVLTSTSNEDGSSNLAPISCVWWLGWSCVLGLDVSSKSTNTLERERQCVLNLPSAQLVGAVDRLACLTGSNPIPDHKKRMGYRYEPDKFKVAGLTSVASDLVKALRVKECPVQLEAVVENIRPFGEGDLGMPFPAVAVEMRVVRVHVHKSIVVTGKPNRIDPEKWRPLITSFRQYFGLGLALHSSRFSQFPETTFAPKRFPSKSTALKESAIPIVVPAKWAIAARIRVNSLSTLSQHTGAGETMG